MSYSFLILICFPFRKYVGPLEHLGTILFSITSRDYSLQIIPAIEISNIWESWFHFCTDMRSKLTGNISLGRDHQGLSNRGLKSKVETLSRTVAPTTRNWRLKWQALLCFQADHEVNQDQLEQQAEESVVFHLSGGWVSLSHLTSVDMIHSNSVSIVFDSRIRLEWERISSVYLILRCLYFFTPNTVHDVLFSE